MKVQKSYYIDEEVADELENRAKEEGRSISDFMNRLLKNIFQLK